MTQALRTRDVLRCILLNVPKGPNLACPSQCVTEDKPASNPTIWKDMLAQRRQRVTVASWNGTRLAGLASARMRSGHKAWEVDRLFLALDDGTTPNRGDSHESGSLPLDIDPYGEDIAHHHSSGNLNPNIVALELLEQVARETGQFRTERIFLRLPARSRIFTLARQAGYFPYYEETLVESASRVEAKPVEANLASNWTELMPEDYYSVFQLYCAATPQSVRVALGLTFDQWRDAQEPASHRQSWVSKENGKVVAQVGIFKCGQVMRCEVLADPSNPGLWAQSVDLAVSQGNAQKWLVPDYQEMVSSLLLQRQFRAKSSYSVMVKTVAAPVAKPGMVTVEA